MEKTDDSEYAKVRLVMEPEGNKVELRQPLRDGGSMPENQNGGA